MKVLFVCNQNQHRSRTAEILFRGRFQTESAGLYNDKPVTKKQILDADLVVVMEDAQRREISKRFPNEYMKKQIISLNIPDVYSFNSPELKSLLKSKLSSFQFAS